MILEGHTLFADGYNDAILGSTDDGRIVYSKTLMLEQLVMTEISDCTEAVEFLEYNVWCAYVGEFTPIYVNDLDDDLEEFIKYFEKNEEE